jgi:hypothetical protein
MKPHNEELVKQMRRAANVYAKQFPKFRADINGLRNITYLLAKNDLQGAYKAAWHLDTFPREYIPDPVWKKISTC